jgi:hypothetical protein
LKYSKAANGELEIENKRLKSAVEGLEKKISKK